jgi:hypothetical protein
MVTFLNSILYFFWNITYALLQRYATKLNLPGFPQTMAERRNNINKHPLKQTFKTTTKKKGTLKSSWYFSTGF